MTPMVDVAFLLLTFFMLTTSLMRHEAMEINIPPDSSSIQVPENNLLMLLVNSENTIFWNIGREAPVRVALDGLGDLLIRENRQNSKLITLLKIDRKARYRSL